MNEKYNVIAEVIGKDYGNGISYVDVSDENGNTVTREIDSNNVYYTLLAENKMELIGLKKEELNKEINDALTRIDMIKFASPIFPIVIGVVGGFLILTKIFRPDALEGNSWLGLTSSVAAGELGVGAVVIVEHIYSKKEIKLLRKQLKELEKYENEQLVLNGNINCLEHDFEDENKRIQDEIDNRIKVFTKKKKRI